MNETTGKKAVSLKQMIAAHQKSDAKIEALKEQVEGLAAAGGEPNVITSIKVNGDPVPITGKAVDITVPTGKDISDAAAAAVAGADHLKRKKVASVDAIDLTADDADQYIYMVPKTGGKNGDKYDEYMILDGALEPVGDWTVDLEGYVQKEDGKGLSEANFTAAEKEKLAVIEFATDEEVATALAEIYGTDGD